ncbi:MAG: 6-pyruvoyl tetrahydropterin synthase family protein [Pseudomonadota bacterium]
MYRITKDFAFSASHEMTGLPAGDPCARMHGHNYIVQVELSADELNQYGFVRDYRDLAPLKQHIDTVLDHRHLNDVFGHDAVTAEFLAKALFDWAKARWDEVTAVRVSETPKTWAEYRP